MIKLAASTVSGVPEQENELKLLKQLRSQIQPGYEGTPEPLILWNFEPCLRPLRAVNSTSRKP